MNLFKLWRWTYRRSFSRSKGASPRRSSYGGRVISPPSSSFSLSLSLSLHRSLGASLFLIHGSIYSSPLCRKNKRISKGKKGGKKKMYVFLESLHTYVLRFVLFCFPSLCFCSFPSGFPSFSYVFPFLVIKFNSTIYYLHLCCLCRFRLHSVDPFSKKDWYDIKAPSTFNLRSVGKTLVTRTQGTKVSDLWYVIGLLNRDLWFV